MKILLIVGLVLGGLIGVVLLVGFLLPVGHEARRSAELQAPSAKIWGLISDFEKMPSWRSDLKSVEKISDRNGRTIWKETDKNGDVIEYETLESSPERRLVRKIASEGLPFGGTWTFEVGELAGRSSLTITERGEVYNPVFRFVSKFIMGHTATIDRYLKSLKAELGEA